MSVTSNLVAAEISRDCAHVLNFAVTTTPFRLFHLLRDDVTSRVTLDPVDSASGDFSESSLFHHGFHQVLYPHPAMTNEPVVQILLRRRTDASLSQFTDLGTVLVRTSALKDVPSKLGEGDKVPLTRISCKEGAEMLEKFGFGERREGGTVGVQSAERSGRGETKDHRNLSNLLKSGAEARVIGTTDERVERRFLTKLRFEEVEARGHERSPFDVGERGEVDKLKYGQCRDLGDVSMKEKDR